MVGEKDKKFSWEYLIRSQNPSSSKVGHIYGSLRAALLGFLLHSTVEHIKRRAIIWIGCHVFAPIQTLITQRKDIKESSYIKVQFGT